MKSLVLTLFAFWTTLLNAGQLKLEVRAEKAILVNADNGTVLFEKSADEIAYPASTTKVATAWYILEKYAHRINEQAVVSREAVAYSPVNLKRSNTPGHPSYRLEARATNMHLQPREIMPLRTLLYGLMLVSANDAANVLAEHLCGTIDNFMGELNGFLREKGIENTSFTNPGGFHHTNHRTTARDMALIASQAIRNPLFLEIVGTLTYERPAYGNQPASTLKQFNRLMTPGRYYYPKAIGIKTGHLHIAGFNLVAAAKQGDRTLLAVLLNCKENDDRYRDARALFETAFAEKKVSRILLTKDHEQFKLRVPGAKKILIANMQYDLKLDYYPSEEPQMRSIVNWHVPSLPIKAGQAVGEVVLLDAQQKVLGREALIARECVEPTLWKSITLYGSALCHAPMTIPLLTMIGAVSISAGGVLFIFRRRDYGKKK